MMIFMLSLVGIPPLAGFFGDVLPTAYNDTVEPQGDTAALTRDFPKAFRKARLTKLVAGGALSRSRESWQIQLAPQAVAVLEFPP